MSRIRRNIKGGSKDRVLGKGDDGCVLEGEVSHRECSSFEESLAIQPPPPAHALITKVTTKDAMFRAEWAAAKTLFALDPTQTHFLYPYHACISSIPLSEDTLHACNLPRNARSHVAYLLQMHRRGISLKDMVKQGTKQLTPTQAEDVMHDILAALKLLHYNRQVHGDLHDGNVVVEIDAVTGNARAFLIDFGYLRPLTQEEEVKETKHLVDDILLRSLSSITEGGRFYAFSRADDAIIKKHSFQSVDAIDVRFVAKSARSPASPPSFTRRPLFSQNSPLLSASTVTSATPKRGRKLRFSDDTTSPSSVPKRALLFEG